MKIAVITNVTKDTGLNVAKNAAALLSDKADIYMLEECRLPDEFNINYVSYDELWNNADIAFIIGGDGTLLQAAPNCAKHGIPALGINLGKVGFLTEVEPDDMQTAFDSVLNGSYIIEKRMLINMQINDGSENFQALNDIVVSKPEDAKLIGVELYTDSELVNHYAADGLIIATPTGSTGYSISAGGPVVDPRMDLYVATPICAHMLSVRSAVLPADKDIIIKLSPDYPNNSAIVSADGEKKAVITEKDEVRITRSPYEFELIRIGTSSFYNTLISKLS